MSWFKNNSLQSFEAVNYFFSPFFLGGGDVAIKRSYFPLLTILAPFIYFFINSLMCFTNDRVERKQLEKKQKQLNHFCISLHGKKISRELFDISMLTKLILVW